MPGKWNRRPRTLRPACSMVVRWLWRKGCPHVWKVVWTNRKAAVESRIARMSQPDPEPCRYRPDQQFCVKPCIGQLWMNVWTDMREGVFQ
jgi:hypothetical protein